MVTGKDGWHHWQAQSEIQIRRDRSVAKDAALDKTLPWTARVCAMAIANDVDALKKAFHDVSDTTCGVGAALEEQRSKTDDEIENWGFINDDFQPVPEGHPFVRLCFIWKWCSDDDHYIETEQDQMWSFTTAIAFAAALVGSIETLQVLNQRLDFSLWENILKSLVLRALANPTVDCIVESISAILLCKPAKGYHYDTMLHERHRGSNGNHLHLAAGRGHAKLTKALIEGDMNPNRRCVCIDSRSYRRNIDYGDGHEYYSDSDGSGDVFMDKRDRGVKQRPLPLHWAAHREHWDVVNIISELCPTPYYGSTEGMTDGVKRGHAKRYAL